MSQPGSWKCPREIPQTKNNELAKHAHKVQTNADNYKYVDEIHFIKLMNTIFGKYFGRRNVYLRDEGKRGGLSRGGGLL